MDRNFSRLPVSTSSTDPSNWPRAESVWGPSRTTKAPRMTGSVGWFRDQGVRFPYVFCPIFRSAGSNKGRVKTSVGLSSETGTRRSGGVPGSGVLLISLREVPVERYVLGQQATSLRTGIRDTREAISECADPRQCVFLGRASIPVRGR